MVFCRVNHLVACICFNTTWWKQLLWFTPSIHLLHHLLMSLKCNGRMTEPDVVEAAQAFHDFANSHAGGLTATGAPTKLKSGAAEVSFDLASDVDTGELIKKFHNSKTCPQGAVVHSPTIRTVGSGRAVAFSVTVHSTYRSVCQRFISGYLRWTLLAVCVMCALLLYDHHRSTLEYHIRKTLPWAIGHDYGTIVHWCMILAPLCGLCFFLITYCAAPRQQRAKAD